MWVELEYRNFEVGCPQLFAHARNFELTLSFKIVGMREKLWTTDFETPVTNLSLCGLA